MKNSIAVIAASLTLTGFASIGCTNSASDKVATAQENVTQAKTDLDKANADYLADVENYRKESSEKIAANEKSIAEFNERISNEKAEARVAYKKKIADLEKKNTDMKKRLDDYKTDSKDDWQKFKAEFNHDMDELGNAFRDLTVKNVK